MDFYKRDRNMTFSSHNNGSSNNFPSHQRNNSKSNNRHRAVSSPTPYTNNGKREKGVIEKLLNSYGFLECSSTNYRVFFHYSEYDGDPNDLLVGDCLEFILTTDPRNNKLLAVQLSKLPPGSVVIESMSDEVCIGKVEVEAGLSKNGEVPDVSTVGRVSYDKNGEFFFIPFSWNDIEKGETIHKGDYVSFRVATNKRTGSLKARKLKFSMTAKPVKTIQGIVSSLKESFGFIERADVVSEIFFHYSEYDGDVNMLLIGDDVAFDLQDRLGKQTAVNVQKLVAGTVMFEDISQARYKGHVIKAVHTRSLNNVDGHLTGMIEYQGKNDTHEVLFGDRDTEDDINLQKGDVVEFNVSVDRRDKLQRAVNIKLVSVCLKDGQTRDVGVISSLKEGFGFIKCVDHDLSIFFHFSEVLEQSHIINIGDEVEFTIENDTISRRQHATRIRFLVKGTVAFETISTKRYTGVVEHEAPSQRSIKSPSKTNKEQEFGVIKVDDSPSLTRVHYLLRDCKIRETPHYRDKVEFFMATKKCNGQQLARDLTIRERCAMKYTRGYVCALKDNFGFVEMETHERELFFHFTEVDGDCGDLELGDCVQFVEGKNREKPSAENVTKVVGYTNRDDVLPKVYDGQILRTMRTADPEQAEYEGLVRVIRPDGSEEKSCGNDCYPFGITSILEKKEPLQVGNKVTFQLCIDAVTRVKRATSISCERNMIHGKVESIKGLFGFISYDSEDGKSVFFHMSEVLDNHSKDIKAGDEVRFVIVKSHKNAKKSAVRVQKILDERPEHLTRRRSKRFSECAPNTLTVLRQPSGPDGTTGFNLERNPVDISEEQFSGLQENT